MKNKALSSKNNRIATDSGKADKSGNIRKVSTPGKIWENQWKVSGNVV